MNHTWMKMTVLALSLGAITSTLYAAEEQQPGVESTAPQTDEAATVKSETTTSTEATTASPVAPVEESSQADQAASALQKKETDATQEPTCRRYLPRMNVNIH